MPVAAVKKPAETNIKETVESILVAFVLAFIFRAFVVEAFVIPTGSMAPTLLGANTAYDCPECGYHFAVNYPTGDETTGLNIPTVASYTIGRTTFEKAQAVFCPNCGYRLPRLNKEDPADDATAAPVNYGDRILVMKYVYLLSDPRRWDVVVFKSPEPPRDMPGDYSINYIKRLTGLPGESLFVFDGDLYVLDPKDAPKGRPLHPGDETLFKIQTKPRYAQDALWRIVYDADYVPKSLTAPRPLADKQGVVFDQDPAWEQPWKATGPGWTNGTGTVDHRTFRFDQRTPAESGLAFDASANPNKHAFTDWLPYDVTLNQDWTSDTYAAKSYDNPLFTTTDVKLDFYLRRLGGDGVMKLQLTKRETQFVAELTPTTARIMMKTGDAAWRQVGATAAVSLTDKPTRVTFQNVDYRVALMIDGQEIIASTPAEYAPDLPALIQRRDNGAAPKPDVRIIAADQTAEITHLGLWRDDYYTERLSGRLIERARVDDFPRHVVTLGPKEYFVLGDNSPISGDARVWGSKVDLPTENLKAPAGVVPDRFLLGRAFFVYWPAGYRPLPDKPPAVIPNFGQMRFIH